MPYIFSLILQKKISYFRKACKAKSYYEIIISFMCFLKGCYQTGIGHFLKRWLLYLKKINKN